MTDMSLQQKLDCLSIPEPNSGCQLWTAAMLSTGYGKVTWRGQQLAAHRASYRAHKGEIPAGKHVLHKCDVRACINPDHLFLGTQAENMRDMFKKGRGVVPKPTSLRALHAELKQLRLAVSWALGESPKGVPEFASRAPGDPPYWWRTQLRAIARRES